MTIKPNQNNYKVKHPLERAVEKWRFEVLKKRVSERIASYVFASNRRFSAGFIRAAPYPSDQLKLFSASAVERNRVAFSLDTFFYECLRHSPYGPAAPFNRLSADCGDAKESISPKAKSLLSGVTAEEKMMLQASRPPGNGSRERAGHTVTPDHRRHHRRGW